MGDASMAEEAVILVCAHFRVEKLPSNFYKPGCSRLGVISTLCNPLNLNAAAPTMRRGCLRLGMHARLSGLFQPSSLLASASSSRSWR